VHHIRNKFTAAGDTPERRHVSAHVWDLPEFLCDVLEAGEFPWAQFPHEVALHVSCSAIRGLGEQAMSERPNDPWFSKPMSLLQKVKGISIADFARPDECCGFGGTFSVTEEAVSAAMGNDKLARIGATGARYIVSPDMSCLMHLQGCAHRDREDFRFLHLAQVLNGEAG
jgi:L-lactate dehydrogenase complex protein LldE